MEEDKINCCKKQKNGIELISIKEHLSKAYIDEADNTLLEMLKLEGKWKVITGYYACYNALYSILIKCGIKCEFHSCTIELMYLFNFDNKEIEFLEKLKNDRIQSQYYLKEKKLEDVNKVKDFILKCKLILKSLTNNQIEDIRNKIK